ncbi:MAG TPA: hypothetical protein VMS43_00990 [Allosphingosinicella sp.]|nr:hypothetical protein [Allosphingosinicella sp.]
MALWAWATIKPESSSLGDSVQIFSAVFTIIAVFIAAGIYFLERRDRNRLSFGLEVTAIRPSTASGGRQDNVLLAIRIPVENKGERQVTINCIAVDVMYPEPSARGLVRSVITREEMQLKRIEERIPFETNDNIEPCIQGTVDRTKWTRDRVRPLYMWRPLTLEPSEADDRHLEVLVSCAHPFVRVLLKIRINPRDPRVYETKTIVPLTEICGGRVESTGGVSSPTVGSGDNGGSTPAPAGGGGSAQ